MSALTLFLKYKCKKKKINVLCAWDFAFTSTNQIEKKNVAVCTRYFDFTNTDKTKKFFFTICIGYFDFTNTDKTKKVFYHLYWVFCFYKKKYNNK